MMVPYERSWQKLLNESADMPDALKTFLTYHSLSAAEKTYPPPMLFARTREGAYAPYVRVVVASRFGDVGITRDLNSQFYTHRVPIDTLFGFIGVMHENEDQGRAGA